MRYTQRCTESESRIREYQTKLDAYENIEKELDEVIMQAAESKRCYKHTELQFIVKKYDRFINLESLYSTKMLVSASVMYQNF